MKHFISLAAAAFILNMNVAATNTLEFQWAHSVDGQTISGDNSFAIAKTSDGNYVVGSLWGTASKETNAGNACHQNLTFDGDTLYLHGKKVVGSPYAGTSKIDNLLVQKVNKKTGDVMWTLHSCRGDFYSGANHIAATSDGGMVLGLTTRSFVGGNYENKLDTMEVARLIDANGDTTSVRVAKDLYPNEYVFLLVKLSVNGALEWTRVVKGFVPETFSQKPTLNFKVNEMAVDNEDNIYIAGNYATKLNFTGKDGRVNTFEAQNIPTTWNGDYVQNSIGDLYIAKLTADGYFTSILQQSGTAPFSSVDKMVYHEGRLYFCGRITGNGTELTIGGKGITASEARQTLFAAAVNTDISALDYLYSYTSVTNSGGKFSIQNKNLQYLNGRLYLTGLLNAGLARHGETTAFLDSKTTRYQGFFLGISPVDGTPTAWGMEGTTTAITGYFGVIDRGDSIYAEGYNMAKGVKLDAFAKTQGECLKNANATIDLCDYGMTTLQAPMLTDGEYFVVHTRGGTARNNNNTATFYGTDKSFTKLASWGAVFFCYKFGDVTSGISTVDVAPATDGLYRVYTVSGVHVKNATDIATALAGLHKGIYIVNGKKYIVK